MKRILSIILLGLILVSCNNSEIEKLEVENRKLKSEIKSLKYDYEELVVESSVRQSLPGVYLLEDKNSKFSSIEKVIFVNDSLCILKDKFSGCLFEASFEHHFKDITIKTEDNDLWYLFWDTGVIKGMTIPGIYIKENNKPK